MTRVHFGDEPYALCVFGFNLANEDIEKCVEF